MSKTWLTKHRNDRFFKQAKRDNYNSRAIFKLQEIDQKFKLCYRGKLAIEFGAFPGGWTQYLLEQQMKVIAIDLQQLNLTDPNLSVICQDIYQPQTLDLIKSYMKGEKCHLLCSDMAANTIGIADIDAIRSTQLIEHMYAMSFDLLQVGGHMVVKLFMSADAQIFAKKASKDFARSKMYKPQASSRDSCEIYLVCLGKK